MKKILYLLMMLPLLGICQTTSQNFVKSVIYKDATTDSDETKANIGVIFADGIGRPIQQIAGKASATGKDIVSHIEYDGYGRQAINYLPYASVNSNLQFDSSAKANALDFYATPSFENTLNPYSENVYEESPLNKIIKQANPGNAWAPDPSDNDHTLKYAYHTNNATEVKKLTATALWNPATKVYDISFVSNGNYEAGKLYKTIVQSENKVGAVYTGALSSMKIGTSEEFKNSEGKLLLKRTYNTYANILGQGTVNTLNTYYVYDQFGNLTYVLPPVTAGAFADGTCYQYKYDHRNRIVEKKIPGKQWQYLVYDAQDRVVATGPTFSPFGTGEEGWLYNVYDVHGRLCISGWYPAVGITSATRAALQNSSAGTTNVSRYNQTGSTTIDAVNIDYSLPAGFTLPIGFKLLKVNYYDNYKFIGSPGSPPFFSIEGQNPLSVPKGLPTGSWNRVPTIASETKNEVTYIMYDSKGRVIRNRTANYLGGYTMTSNKLDFDGSLVYTITNNRRNSAANIYTTREDFAYTAQNRLLSHTHKIGTGTVQLMSYNTYNEIGQLISKNVGGTDVAGVAALQKVDYTYNIRGWLKEINDTDDLALPNAPQDLFAFKISYADTIDQTMGGEVRSLYNGNISETRWRTASDNIKRAYGYSYDGLDQLTGSYYYIPTASIPLRNSYNEMISYNLNGNISKIERNGESDTSTSVIEIDDLTYTYDTSIKDRLLKVADATNHPKGFADSFDNTVNDYTYDNNGNLISDRNKGITSISYNHLNLPLVIIFNNSSTQKINYFYNADGIKVQKVVTNGATITTTDYLSGFQYTNTVLDFYPTPEGYVKVTWGTGAPALGVHNYVFNYKDHLGNNRVSYTVDPADGILKILEENHYYPFGLKHNGYSRSQQMLREVNYAPFVVITPVVNPTDATYKIKYNGKELQDELGLNVYDYGWRNYMPDIGRWMQVDPLQNDLNFAFDDSKVDEDDDDEVLEAILTKAEVGDGIFNTNNLNPYAYGYNNPVVYDDPDGRCPACIIVAALLLYSEFANAPTGNARNDSRNYNASKGNRTIATETILKRGGNLLGTPGKGNGAKQSNGASQGTEKGKSEKTYQTYTKDNKKTGETYSGKTSGKGTPVQNVAKRDTNHHKNKDGFGPAKLDKSSKNPDAIRGREQQNINNNGGAKSQGGTSGNSINSVSPKNPNAQKYNDAANKEFGG